MVDNHRRLVGDRAMSAPATDNELRLGLKQNIAQFSLLVGVNALVGGMIGQERTVLPLLAKQEFGLTAFTASLTFIVAFGVVKAVTNFFAGTLSDRTAASRSSSPAGSSPSQSRYC